MISRATDAFWKAYRNLPDQVQQRAKTAYRIWQENPGHPSLQFKQIHSTEPIYSVRIGLGWRAVGVRSGETIVWYWIGSHADYDTLISLFRRNA
ncbi:MAG TPA: hypothetical protein VIW78_00590 [Burkholderiales bacterium]